jgi:hypothetical protein
MAFIFYPSSSCKIPNGFYNPGYSAECSGHVVALDGGGFVDKDVAVIVEFRGVRPRFDSIKEQQGSHIG